jgi:hypothetical protein
MHTAQRDNITHHRTHANGAAGGRAERRAQRRQLNGRLRVGSSQRRKSLCRRGTHPRRAAQRVPQRHYPKSQSAKCTREDRRRASSCSQQRTHPVNERPQLAPNTTVATHKGINSPLQSQVSRSHSHAEWEAGGDAPTARQRQDERPTRTPPAARWRLRPLTRSTSVDSQHAHYTHRQRQQQQPSQRT